MSPAGKRPRVIIEPSDEKRLLRALERWADSGDFVALRTRAFVLLLWDGSVRTSEALAMDVQDVLKDSRAQRLTVFKTVVLKPRVENKYRRREIVLSTRAQEALADYLRAVRQRGWLPAARSPAVPLFLATLLRGKTQRLSPRSAIHWWEHFQKNQAKDCSRMYQLDDVVYDGRIDYVRAAGGDSQSLSDHSGISRRWAAEYRQESNVTPKDVVARLDKAR